MRFRLVKSAEMENGRALAINWRYAVNCTAISHEVGSCLCTSRCWHILFFFFFQNNPNRPVSFPVRGPDFPERGFQKGIAKPTSHARALRVRPARPQVIEVGEGCIFPPNPCG